MQGLKKKNPNPGDLAEKLSIWSVRNSDWLPERCCFRDAVQDPGKIGPPGTASVFVFKAALDARQPNPRSTSPIYRRLLLPAES